jgi:hypothetical protein
MEDDIWLCRAGGMNIGIARALASIVAGAVLLLAPVPAVLAQSNTVAKPSSLAAEEKATCTQNLKVIYEAIQKYQTDHKDLPNWLSDLVPDYLPDLKVLTCPVCRRTGKTEAPPLADPKISSSYLFEFCPAPLGSMAPNAPNHTRREWKRRQMGLVGSGVPIVRCRFHSPLLNVSFDGKIYDSPAQWESVFTNRVGANALSATTLFGDVPPLPPSPPPYPLRDVKARPQLFDLSKFYNTRLTDFWPSNTLGGTRIVNGLHNFEGIEFDLRGIIQLASKSLPDKRFPAQVKNIPVHQKCKQLHFLYGVRLETDSPEGCQIASCYVHFTGYAARLEIPVYYGPDVRDWHRLPGEPAPPTELTLPWKETGSPGESKRPPVRVFKTAWANLAPDVEIDTLELVSAMAAPVPLLIAITAE